jgi:DNA polymerase-3 subunit alpha
MLFGLRHIKNVGEKVIDSVLAARDSGGPFTSLLDLVMRADGDLNRRVLESLIRCGACDSLGERRLLLTIVDRVIERSAQLRRERESGQTALFGEEEGFSTNGAAALDGEVGIPASLTPAPEHDRLAWERELLGMYLSDHPLRRHAAALHERVDTTIGELGLHLEGLYVQVGGLIRSMRAFVPRRSTTGQRMAFLQLEDLTGVCEVIVFARKFEECAELLAPDGVIVVRGQVQAAQRSGGGATASDDPERADAEPCSVVAEAVYALDDARLEGWRRHSEVRLSVSAAQSGGAEPLRHLLEKHAGESRVVLSIVGSDRVDEVALPESFSVEPGPALERAVEAMLGADSYHVIIHRERAPAREQRRRPERPAG